MLKNCSIISWIFGILVDPPTIRTLSILSFEIPDSFIVFSKHVIHFLKYLSHKVSKFPLVIFIEKSFPSDKASISISDSFIEERSFLTLSHAIFNLLKAFLFEEISILLISLNSLMQNLINSLSKSSPPKWPSPPIVLTLNLLLLISKIVISKVPPPKSKTQIFFLFIILLLLSNA